MAQVIAHRGASKAERENTVAAFRGAAALGADAVELDVRRTADGTLVVHHNPGLAGGELIVDLHMDELPAHIPTLDDALDACAGMWVNVEIKNDPGEPDFDPSDRIADATIEVLTPRGEDGRWLISSFRLETIDRCRLVHPSIATAWLTVALPDDVAGLLAERGHRALHPWFPLVTPDLVDRCHAAGVQVNPWTCDDPAVMAELIAAGVDGICTNVPDIAIGVRAGRR